MIYIPANHLIFELNLVFCSYFMVIEFAIIIITLHINQITLFDNQENNPS